MFVQHDCEVTTKAAEDQDKLRKELADAVAQVKSLEDERETVRHTYTHEVRSTNSQAVLALTKLDAKVQVGRDRDIYLVLFGLFELDLAYPRYSQPGLL